METIPETKIDREEFIALKNEIIARKVSCSIFIKAAKDPDTGKDIPNVYQLPIE